MPYTLNTLNPDTSQDLNSTAMYAPKVRSSSSTPPRPQLLVAAVELPNQASPTTVDLANSAMYSETRQNLLKQYIH